jgi:VTC domain
MDRADLVKKLNEFNPIGLEEMNNVNLMNRTDSKYVFSFIKLDGLLEIAKKHYHILQLDHLREFPYSTIYLDTPDLMFFNQHINGKLPRYKIRYRIYEHSGQSFLEIKSKTSNNNTIKERIDYKPVGEKLDPSGSDFIQRLVPIDPSSLRPALIDRFVRITLVSLETAERITIDYNLSFENNSGKVVELPSVAIAELKRERLNKQSQFTRLIKEFKVRKTGFSKYCMGISMLNNPPKQNSLKSKFLLISKIENAV